MGIHVKANQSELKTKQVKVTPHSATSRVIIVINSTFLVVWQEQSEIAKGDPIRQFVRPQNESVNLFCMPFGGLYFTWINVPALRFGRGPLTVPVRGCRSGGRSSNFMANCLWPPFRRSTPKFARPNQLLPRMKVVLLLSTHMYRSTRRMMVQCRYMEDMQPIFVNDNLIYRRRGKRTKSLIRGPASFIEPSKYHEAKKEHEEE